MLNEFRYKLFWAKKSLSIKERDIFPKVIDELVKAYHYNRKQIDTEVKLPEGEIADIIVFNEKEKKSPLIIVEIKKSLIYPIATHQIERYMRLSKAKYGLLTNGEIKSFFQLIDEKIIRIPDIPKRGEREHEVFLKGDLKLTRGLEYSLQKIRDHLEDEGLSVEKIVEETQKLILSKLFDERSPHKEIKFWISPKEISVFHKPAIRKAFYDRINLLFFEVKEIHPDLYGKSEKLELDPKTLSFVVAELQDYSLNRMPSEVLLNIFQDFVIRSIHGYLGEYSTPKSLVKFIVRLLDPDPYENILDPACGTGQFLVESMYHVQKKIRIMTRNGEGYPSVNVFGLDINPQMVLVTKLNMILHGDGHANIFSRNSLLPLIDMPKFLPKNFDIVVTDPPLSGIVTKKELLESYSLGKGRRKQRIIILFVEKCLEMLKPEGRLAMIVPDALLSNASLGYVRKFILENSSLEAVVSLPLSFSLTTSGVKSSILILRKAKSFEKNYNVFMGNVEEEIEESIDEIIEQYSRFKSKHFPSFSKSIFAKKVRELGRRWDVISHQSIDVDLSESKPLGEICHILPGSKVSSKKYLEFLNSDSTPYVRISDMVDGKLAKDALRYVRKDIRGSRIRLDDVLISVRGTIGKTAIVTETFSGSIASSQIAILRPKKNMVYPKYLFRLLSSKAVSKQIARLKREQFIPYLSLNDLRSILFPYCPLNEQISIVDRIEQLEKEHKRLGKKKKEIEARIHEILGEVGQ